MLLFLVAGLAGGVEDGLHAPPRLIPVRVVGMVSPPANDFGARAEGVGVLDEEGVVDLFLDAGVLVLDPVVRGDEEGDGDVLGVLA